MERDHQVRRMLGLFAFFYATLHMLTWVVFVHYFEVSFMIEDVVKRPFITVGMTTFLLLLVLALTSNRLDQKAGRRWASCIGWRRGGRRHTAQLVKADTTEPWRWAAGFALLFGFACGGRIGRDYRWRPHVKGQTSKGKGLKASRIV